MLINQYSNSLRAGRSGDRIPVGGARFSALVQTGPGAHPAPHTVGQPPQPPSSAEVKDEVDLYLHSPSGPSWTGYGVDFNIFSNSRLQIGLICRYSRLPLIRTSNYPYRLGPSDKFIDNSTKPTCLPINCYRIKYTTVLWLLEFRISRGRMV